jgi:ubiquinone biosynthesis protein UbiJ
MSNQHTSVLDCLNTLAHELEWDPGYAFSCLSDMHGETFARKLARVRHTIEAAERSIASIRKWAPECFPADANGQVHFARSLMESVADDLEGGAEP